MKNINITVEITTNTSTYQTTFPGKKIICPHCDGEGKHVNSAVEHPMGGITASEWEEAGPEFRYNYTHGLYDIECERCHGNKIIVVIDETKLTQEHQDDYKAYLDMLEQMLYFRQEQEAERRAGC